MKYSNLETEVIKIINLLGLDSSLKSSSETAIRVAKMYMKVFSGVGVDTKTILQPLMKVSDEKFEKQLIIINSIPFFSMCEHHFLPFWGYVDICYIPKNWLVGFSKFTQLVNIISRKPQMLEKICEELSLAITESVEPIGLGIHIISKELCTSMLNFEETRQIVSTIKYQGELENNISFQKLFISKISTLT